MAKTRALMTDTERMQIAGEHGSDRRYQAVSRVRARVEEELEQDLEVLREHHPKLLAEIYRTVCGDYDCPRCGKPFDYPWNAHDHASETIDDKHGGYSKEEAPAWWPDDPPDERDPNNE